MPDTSCWQCAGDIPEERGQHARFCSPTCTDRYWGIEGDATQTLPRLGDDPDAAEPGGRQ